MRNSSPFPLVIMAVAPALPLLYLAVCASGDDFVPVALIALVCVVGVAVGLSFVSHSSRQLPRHGSGREESATHRGSDEPLHVAAIESLPADTGYPVRVRGHLRLHIDGDGLEVRIEDESGSAVVLPVPTELHQIAGEEVEVIGVGRVATSGKSYRETESVFTFDGEETTIVRVA
jgi:hypothetical protein